MHVDKLLFEKDRTTAHYGCTAVLPQIMVTSAPWKKVLPLTVLCDNLNFGKPIASFSPIWECTAEGFPEGYRMETAHVSCEGYRTDPRNDRMLCDGPKYETVKVLDGSCIVEITVRWNSPVEIEWMVIIMFVVSIFIIFAGCLVQRAREPPIAIAVEVPPPVPTYRRRRTLWNPTSMFTSSYVQTPVFVQAEVCRAPSPPRVAQRVVASTSVRGQDDPWPISNVDASNRRAREMFHEQGWLTKAPAVQPQPSKTESPKVLASTSQRVAEQPSYTPKPPTYTPTPPTYTPTPPAYTPTPPQAPVEAKVLASTSQRQETSSPKAPVERVVVPVVKHVKADAPKKVVASTSQRG